MRLYLAGSDNMGRHSVADLTHKYGVHKMFSAMHERLHIQSYPTLFPGSELMIDSGAHSWNKTTITSVGAKPSKALPPVRQWLTWYERFITRFCKYPFVFVELDVYGVLPPAMIDAMHGRVQALLADQPASFLRVYHTILDNGTFDVLRQWIDAGETYIGLGVEAIPYLDAIFRITRDQIRVHGFALSRHNILSRYPFYSVDSSTALATTRFGGYMRADFSFKSRKRCLRDRDVNIVRSEEARIHLALEAAARFQAHYTELWERRGVTWPET